LPIKDGKVKADHLPGRPARGLRAACERPARKTRAERHGSAALPEAAASAAAAAESPPIAAKSPLSGI